MNIFHLSNVEYGENTYDAWHLPHRVSVAHVPSDDVGGIELVTFPRLAFAEPGDIEHQDHPPMESCPSDVRHKV